MLRLDAKIESKQIPVKNTDEIIQQICKLAKSKNKEALSKLISEILCIDITNGKTTAIEILATENEVEAVNLLLEEFKADINNALIGAAAGGHHELIHKLLTKGADIDAAAIGAGKGGDYQLAKKMVYLGAELIYVAMGAGMGNQQDVLKKLFQEEADVDRTLLDRAIYGAAGSHGELTESLIRRKLPSILEKKQGFIMSVLPFAAFGGNSELIDVLITTYLKEFPEVGFISNLIILSSAQGGHPHLMEKYIAKGEGEKESINSAAKGSVLGGHFDQVENMISRGANIDDMLSVALTSNHPLLVKYLISRGAKSDGAAGFAFINEKYELAANLIMKEAKIDIFTRSIKEHIQKDDKNLLRLLTSLSESWRSQLATEIKTSMPEIKLDMTALAKMDVLMHEKGLSYRQALIWESPEIQGYLAYYSSTKHFSPDSSFIIASYITEITKKEFEDLFHKMSLDLRKINLNFDLESCYRSSGLFSPFRDKRPKEFASICKDAKSEKELDLLLVKENLSLAQSKESSYKSLIQSHIEIKPRFKS